MGDKLEHIISQNAPEYWVAGNGSFELTANSPEYLKIYREVIQALPDVSISIERIERFQNVHNLGQFLVREQHLLCLNPNNSYYRVHRFVRINKFYLKKALEHNLDYRRCMMSELRFHKNISTVDEGDVILVVQVLTSNFNCAEIIPERSSDYFIDYIVYY